ncbi:ATP-binding cassette domain-containing protein [Thioalkalivibrio thiocyanoxidans]|uniref:ATP-binding cassette domain-containing protein n=1 Tax=Thioalkalivibrio thiocyanoxidans TaxID=152475 RepID=UPI00036827AF|nr:ATP-binding cassette domain-containing protein [Thioalkalivibrio thiocyanoxidans]
MALLTLRDIHLAYGMAPLLDGLNLSLEPGERVAVAGRNGEGKSTLLKVIAGAIQPDSGEVVRQDGLTTAWLTQELPPGVEGTVFDVVAEGLGESGQLLERFHHLSQAAASGDAEALEKMGPVQARLDAIDGWSLQNRVETTLSRLELDPEAGFAALSGGLKRRVWLARELVREPQLLLLDEPTNHLDVAAIRWLEEFLRGSGLTVVFISHDRQFMEQVATRILELNRGQVYEHPPSIEAFRTRQAERLEVEARQRAEFDRKLAQEETWIRQGIKARRTRNEGRVRALQALRRKRAERRERGGQVRMQLSPEQRSGRLVIEAEHADFGYDDTPVVRDVNLLLQRGDALGIVGPNGAGKTTLLRGLLGQVAPLSGTVKLGTQLEIAYFDQARARLDETTTVQDAVGEGRDRVTVNGETRHVLSYLGDFLFPPERARQPVSALSGGERNRLLLAKLFLRPANLLVLDEPTNDLDVETLELLEQLLIEYTGTVIVVSHDRAFLDNVATSTLVLPGDGTVEEFVGGWSDLPARVTQRLLTREADTGTPPPAEPEARVRPDSTPAEPAPPPRARKLSYKEARELKALPGRIEALETEHQSLAEALSDPEVLRDGERVRELQGRLEQVERDLAVAFERWEALESP